MGAVVESRTTTAPAAIDINASVPHIYSFDSFVLRSRPFCALQRRGVW
jgi:hypothetical protein